MGSVFEGADLGGSALLVWFFVLVVIVRFVHQLIEPIVRLTIELNTMRNRGSTSSNNINSNLSIIYKANTNKGCYNASGNAANGKVERVTCLTEALFSELGFKVVSRIHGDLRG